MSHNEINYLHNSVALCEKPQFDKGRLLYVIYNVYKLFTSLLKFIFFLA